MTSPTFLPTLTFFTILAIAEMQCTSIKRSGVRFERGSEPNLDNRTHASELVEWFYSEYTESVPNEIRIISPRDWPRNSVRFRMPTGELVLLEDLNLVAERFSYKDLWNAIAERDSNAIRVRQDSESGALLIRYSANRNVMLRLNLSPILETPTLLICYLDVELDSWFSDEWILFFSEGTTPRPSLYAFPLTQGAE